VGAQRELRKRSFARAEEVEFASEGKEGEFISYSQKERDRDVTSVQQGGKRHLLQPRKRPASSMRMKHA